jgi:L-fuconolactonase
MRGHPVFDRRHDLSDLDAERGAVEIEGIVFVEVNADRWGEHLREARWVQGLADGDPRLKAIVAAAPLEKGAAVEEDLHALKALRCLRGIRRLIQDEELPGFCLQPAFVEGVRQLPRFGLSFDICVRHRQMRDAVALARECPEVSFVLDHIGKPGIKEGLMEPWRAEIAELARLPNVSCKLSGVVTEADHEHWTRGELRPYVEHVIACFGFDRVMYGSDWTVAKQTHAYPEWVAILDEITAGCSEAERRRLFRDNAVRFYRLEA